MTSPTASFALLGVPDALVRALHRAGIDAPFPIQADTLPDTLAGRDVLGRGRTGSGKTLAFSIPVVARLAADRTGRRVPNRPRGLILAPTRELATQIAAALEPLTAPHSMRVTTVFGGVSQHRQVQALRAGVDIVVACPGRLEDLMRQGLIALDAVEITVIDEADHMADLGFLPGVTRILAATPADGQRLLFSATLDNGVDRLVKRFLSNAVLHSVDEATSPVAAMTHHVFEVAGPAVKTDLVHRLASGTGRRILFTRTKHQAKRLAKNLTAAGIPAVDLHGNLAQGARDRNLAVFASGEARVLVATDVAARGVHVDGVELVVHVDPPAEHKSYLHRSGRTARAGSTGDVVTIVLPEQRKDMAALMRKAAITVRPHQVTAASEPVAQLVGEIAPLVTAAPKPNTPVQEQAAKGGRRRGGSATGGRGRGATADGSRHRGATSDGGRGRGATSDGARTRGAAAEGGHGRATMGNRGRTGSGPGKSGHVGSSPAKRGGHARTAAENSASQGHSGGGHVSHGDGGARRQRSAAGGGKANGRGSGAAPAGSTGGLAGFSRTGGGARRRRG
ncbi:DEAD/DEAH box helicase [Nocardia sp. CDC159]|uniref:DEAD/DEAH box helicase n=1 Tax=Nocardia pulmonis TaxID=2951408 RepID=A0A9X2EA40_9NOCA|nr:MULTISPECIES: DEAD/DEAH box helicase [Nocardia]MCM6776496.1 DEAD/DEAH box helicase [Nocardia pulmonis]MCM6788920.1 DEAD/DEAH box helicase [Nocardia sp. CDC159]